MNLPRRIAVFFALANVLLGTAGTCGLLYVFGFMLKEWSNAQWGEASRLGMWLIPAGLIGYWLWWGYIRFALGRRLGVSMRCFWLLSTLYNAFGLWISIIYGLLGWLFPGFAWFVLAAGLSAWAWRASPKQP